MCLIAHQDTTKTISASFSSIIPNGIGISIIISPFSTQSTTITPSIKSLRGSIIQKFYGRQNYPQKFKWGSTISRCNTAKKKMPKVWSSIINTILKLPKSYSLNLSSTSTVSINFSPSDRALITHLILLGIETRNSRYRGYVKNFNRFNRLVKTKNWKSDLIRWTMEASQSQTKDIFLSYLSPSAKKGKGKKFIHIYKDPITVSHKHYDLRKNSIIIN